MIMAYKILYIEDLISDSRESDLKSLGFEVEAYDPSKDLGEILSKIKPDLSALILDYRLTKGENQICFDAPTIAQTLRSKHSESNFEIPIILMSNEDIITEYYDNLTSHDLFDFTITKKEFNDDKNLFNKKLISFILAYNEIKSTSLKNCNQDMDAIELEIAKILAIDKSKVKIHSRIILKLSNLKDEVFEVSNFIYSDLVKPIGPLIGEDVLAARLGILKTSADWNKVKESIKSCLYNGIFSDFYSRWWMDKVNLWWSETVKCNTPLRRLDAEERVDIIKDKLVLTNLDVVEKTAQSNSSNFWTICQYSKKPIDPFDGIELLKDYTPWQEKEYLSIDSALAKIDKYKKILSSADKKMIRELAQNMNVNG